MFPVLLTKHRQCEVESLNSPRRANPEKTLEPYVYFPFKEPTHDGLYGVYVPWPHADVTDFLRTQYLTLTSRTLVDISIEAHVEIMQSGTSVWLDNEKVWRRRE